MATTASTPMTTSATVNPSDDPASAGAGAGGGVWRTNVARAATIAQAKGTATMLRRDARRSSLKQLSALDTFDFIAH
jgi:hypothetical protein